MLWLTKNAVIIWDDQFVFFALSSLSRDGHVSDLEFDQESFGHGDIPQTI